MATGVAMKIKQKEQYKNVYRIIIIGLAGILFGLINYRSASLDNCKSYSGCISDIEYDVEVRQPMVTFHIGKEKFYYEFTDNFVYDRDVILFERLSNDKTVVTLSVTDHDDIFRLMFLTDSKHVVDIRNDNNIYFDINDYNSSKLFRKILCCSLGGLMIFIGIIIWKILRI